MSRKAFVCRGRTIFDGDRPKKTKEEDSFFVFEAKNLCFALRSTLKKNKMKCSRRMVSIMFERELNAIAFDNFRLHRVLTFVQSISYKKKERIFIKSFLD